MDVVLNVAVDCLAVIGAFYMVLTAVVGIVIWAVLCALREL